MEPAQAITPLFPRTVFIGSERLITSWSACGGRTSQVIAAPFTDLTCVFELIAELQPDVVVVEQTLAAQRAGTALMDRLHHERCTRGTEIRLLSPHRAAGLASGPGAMDPEAWLKGLAQALPPRIERCAARVRASADEQVLIDGQAVALIDLSAAGAQVRSRTALRPRQRVGLELPPQRGSVKAAAVVAWSTFEITPAPAYRAGVAFSRAVPDPA